MRTIRELLQELREAGPEAIGGRWTSPALVQLPVRAQDGEDVDPMDRPLDGPLMRVMDGLMAIPAILLAITLVAMWRASLVTVVAAIAITEIPRVTRLVRSLVLSIREEPYVEAAVALGTPTWKIMFGHILPNCVAPLIVQGTYICAAAILVEAILSFLGVGLPPDIPTWGNIMSEGRVQFMAYPHNLFFPGVFLAVTVLAVNTLGDGLRDTLDPKMAKRV